MRWLNGILLDGDIGVAGPSGDLSCWGSPDVDLAKNVFNIE
jgi:hypothetical protein